MLSVFQALLLADCGDGQTACSHAYNFRVIEMYEEKTCGNRRTWAFINLMKRPHLHVSCFVCTQICIPEYTQSFRHFAPGARHHIVM